MRRAVLLLLAALLAGGCGPVGMVTAVKRDLESEVSGTLQAGMARAKAATLASLKKMGTEVTSVGSSASGERILAQTSEHSVQIDLEALHEGETRMTVKIGDGLLRQDRPTAERIIEETQQALRRGGHAAARAG